MVTIPTTKESRAQIISDIEGAIGQSVPWLPKAFVRVLATALSGVTTLLYRFGQWVYRQIFTQTADREALLWRGDEYGLTPTAAQSAQLTATVTGTDGTQIPVGKLWKSSESGVIYRQEATVSILSGSAIITVTALTAGEIGNLSNGKTISADIPIAGMDDDATVASTVRTGEDEEALEDFRTRVIERQQNQPQGGAAPDYVGWAREVSGIVKAFAFRTADGIITIYPLVGTGASRIPSAAKIQEVKDYVDVTSRRPLGASVLVAAQTEIAFDYEITGLLPNTAGVKAAIDTAFENYLYARYPKQYPDEPNATSKISPAEMYGLAVSAGAYGLVLTVKKGGVAITDYYELSYNELAKPGSATYA